EQGLGDWNPGQRALQNTGRPYMSGSDVRYVQRKVGVKVDGKFGPRTQAGVMQFQRTHGLNPTGVVDGATWNTLQNDGGSILSDDLNHLLDWVTGHTEDMDALDKLSNPVAIMNADFGHSKKWIWWLGGGVAVAGLAGMLVAKSSAK